MNKEEIKSLNKLAKNNKFNEIIKKLTINKDLLDKEKEFLLTIALFFLKYYDKNKKFTTYIEFSYYMILKYSIQYQDYKPLYDFSTEFGFYPIARNIHSLNLINNLGIKDILIDLEIDSFSYQNQYIQTMEQFDIHKKILKEEGQEIAFIAPTSFGKSSIVVDLIKKYNTDNIKIGVIVPTKSLLTQTFNSLKKENLEKRLLLHDEMYNKDDKSFIAIFTQERALRLLKNQNIYFDILFIDEAHNIFKKDSRSILLSRLIKRNLQRNSDTKLIYLSPLIQDINNLKVSDTQIINEQRIHFNIKEPEIFEYLADGNMRQYNRFTGDFYNIRNEKNYLEYIKNHSLFKNFIYLKKPKMIEIFANELADKLPEIDGVQNIVDILNENIHEDFYVSKLLSKGVIYIHGQMPDIIKEYLEYKFKTIPSLKYIIANTVILEGINLPIDNMFVLNVEKLSEKDLTNLIGRINRLNTIFTPDTNNLHKLLPKVHFLNTYKYGRKNGKMENTIKKLRSRLFKDEINNPTLESFDREKLNTDLAKIVENENFLQKDSIEEIDKLKQYFIENELTRYYIELDDVLENILNTIRNIYKYFEKWKEKRLIDKISHLFIEKNIDFIQEYEFKRLEFKPTRKYYSIYIQRSHQNTLKENINYLFGYFKKRIEEKNSEFYFGKSYGEISKTTSSYNGASKNVYINLSSKKDNELINLAIVKLQIEDNFISHTLNRFVEMMHDYKLITDQEYNLHIYGTENPKNIDFIKLGLSNSLISRLDSDGQLKNISIDNYGNLKYNEEFKKFLENIDNFYKFQISKFISEVPMHD